MGTLHLTRHTSATPAAVWDVVTDFAGYGDWMPMTRMVTDDGAPRLGWGFAGISGVGPLAFSDSMLVTQWDPPASGDQAAPAVFRIVKTGRLLGGWAEITLTPEPRVGTPGTWGTRLDWVEDVVVRPMPFKRFFAPVLDRASTWLYGRAINAMLARAAESSR
ncbi:SRPBCC family protein [Pedococcus sp. KACC 23699]|uniref:SRPBCC family protein n=1 Tax=Pedococcus sp. KACC 23699 TaxID=3149228 RepID=A0AAU7JQE6_9MICO